MTHQFEKEVTINASPDIIWNTLTNPELMKKWMGEPEMEIEVETNWQVNSPIVISGFHHLKFQNRGKVLQYKINNLVQYSHLSSLSGLEDKPENYSVITFWLIPGENETTLSCTINNFPTETIFKHLQFYWRTTIISIKNMAEKEWKS